MNRILLSTVLALSLFACGGGDDDDGKDPTNPGGSTGNRMTAKLDGVAWTGSGSVSGSQGGARVGSMNITGTNLSPQVSLVLTLGYVDGPGTYPLGVNYLTNAGGIGSVARTTNLWQAPLSGAAGSVTITMRTATRIAGTFAFTAEPVGVGGAPVVVTDGEFDITKAAGLPALPTGKASTVSADVAGAHFNGATVTVELSGQRVGASNTSYAMGFGFHETPIQGHTYAIGPDANMSASKADNNDSWISAAHDSVGYVTISKIAGERLEGTFAGHLDPQGTATTPLVITNGTFSVHIP